MKKQKEEKGITIILLIITVIMMLILITVGTSTGIKSYENAAVTKFIMQMQLLQKKVDQICEKYNEDNLLEYIQTIGKRTR